MQSLLLVLFLKIDEDTMFSNGCCIIPDSVIPVFTGMTVVQDCGNGGVWNDDVACGGIVGVRASPQTTFYSYHSATR